METVDICPPYTLNSIFEAFDATFKKVQGSPEYVTLTERGKRPKLLVIVDALVSLPGLLMPWERVVKFCQDHENVWSLVDAAHALGQIVDINLNRTQPDFWVSVGCILTIRKAYTETRRYDRTVISGCTPNEHVQSCMFHGGESTVIIHKRQKYSCQDRNQHIIKSTLPTSPYYISPEEYTKDTVLPPPSNFAKQFGCMLAAVFYLVDPEISTTGTGTHDPTPYLSIKPGLLLVAFVV